MKLAQAKYLLSRVTQFEKLISNKFNCKPSVMIAGDFNSTPGDKVWSASATFCSFKLNRLPKPSHGVLCLQMAMNMVFF